MLSYSDYIYDKLNIADITTFISGKLWNGNIEFNNKLENIAVNELNTNNSDVIESMVNINIIVQNLANKTPNSKRLYEIREKVMNILNSHIKFNRNPVIRVLNKTGAMPYMIGSDLSYINIKLKINKINSYGTE